MSTKTKTVFLCTDCGDDFAKWAGQCPSCKTWGTLQEMSISENKRSSSKMATPPKSAIAFNELLETWNHWRKWARPMLKFGHHITAVLNCQLRLRFTLNHRRI